MATLGERIRKLRKEKGLTLQALAGEGLSKGMLSLIENNKANPSIESLSHIARQLGVERNELLEEIPSADLRKLLDEVEELYKTNGTDDLILEHKEIATKIHPYIGNLPFRYESARLLEIYSRCCYNADSFDWQPALERAEEIYEGLHLINHSADVHMFRALMKFTEHDYAEALSMLQSSRAMIEERSGVLDPLKKLDFDYYESILYSATGDGVNSKRLMDEAIVYSKKKRIFYRVDALYRLAAFQAMLDGNPESKDYYIGKIKLYAEFSDDPELVGFADFIEIHYLTSFAHEYEKAEALLESTREKFKEVKYFYFLEKGKLLFRQNRFADAVDCLNKHEILEFVHHPYDLSLHYEKDAYLALAHEKLGNHDEALKYAQIAKDNIHGMPDLPYKTFILDVYRKINS
jgi:transcriptional regulator with XRE-family HTH domain